MKNYALKKYADSSKNWVTPLNSLEIQWKKQVRPQNSNLYAYAANNPVKYTDPDGRANTYSYKFSENKYGYCADLDTIQGAARSLYGIIPFIGDLINNDKVNYEAKWDGTSKWFSYNRDEINQLKDELKLLNKLLQEEN